MVAGQALRATRTLNGALSGEGERDAAADELRTYMTLLLISAPVLMDAAVTRTFLTESQKHAGELARALSATASGDHPDDLEARLTAAGDRVRAAAQPLLTMLGDDQRVVAESVASIAD